MIDVAQLEDEIEQFENSMKESGELIVALNTVVKLLQQNAEEASQQNAQIKECIHEMTVQNDTLVNNLSETSTQTVREVGDALKEHEESVINRLTSSVDELTKQNELLFSQVKDLSTRINSANLDKLEARISDIQRGMNTRWLLFGGIVVSIVLGVLGIVI